MGAAGVQDGHSVPRVLCSHAFPYQVSRSAGEKYTSDEPHYSISYLVRYYSCLYPENIQFSDSVLKIGNVPIFTSAVAIQH